MPIALIAIHYPPLSTSTAVQLRDLAQEFVQQGHEIIVLTPCSDLGEPWALEVLNGVKVLSLAAPRILNVGYFRRTIGEALLSFAMIRGIRKSPFRSTQWSGIVWYSPTIFLGPLVGVLKRLSACRTYLIVRDIFPEWAVDLGLLRRSLIYHFFKLVERYQYSVADTIGVQSETNLAYFTNWSGGRGRSLEVLQNWLAPARNVGSTIAVARTPLAGRTIFVYTGNMGISQGMDILLDLAERLRSRQDVGFLFVGRGSEVTRLSNGAKQRALDNVVFENEVDPSEMPGLLTQCHIGLVALDPRHKTNNVPGKFLTYIQSGLPVLARINPGNDLAALIENEGVGRVYVGDSLDALQAIAEELVDNQTSRALMAERGPALARKLFSPSVAVGKITEALFGHD